MKFKSHHKEPEYGISCEQNISINALDRNKLLNRSIVEK